MIRLEPGTFTMGSPSGEEGREDDETQHQVTLSRSFLLGKTEVTQEQWQAVMGWNPSASENCGADCPVERVSWTEAVEFCNKLSAKEGLRPCYTGSGNSVSWDHSCTGYRLPTEAEWEYAVRDGSMSAHYGKLGAIAWYDQNSGSTTHVVGGKQANAWGLYDMLGNVWEWVWDWLGNYPSSSVADPTGPISGSRRVVRGGSWDSYAGYCRAANRNYFDPVDQDRNLGFRLARSL
ncbi:MAG: hypothetical protein A2284_09205 [Deltaproteobacteria bacterium RIFOXYA12_FULL_61_11]|nr:MAG: hypothetical protein A2284_09205 [Deltaproteobacteria bacterium RIFOXYA12_FULL_61_11]